MIKTLIAFYDVTPTVPIIAVNILIGFKGILKYSEITDALGPANFDAIILRLSSLRGKLYCMVL